LFLLGWPEDDQIEGDDNADYDDETEFFRSH
jgi:hypothetical protein